MNPAKKPKKCNRNAPVIAGFLIVIVSAIAIAVYYLGLPNIPGLPEYKGHLENGAYLFEIEEDGVNPGIKGPFPTAAPYVAPPTVPPPNGMQ